LNEVEQGRFFDLRTSTCSVWPRLTIYQNAQDNGPVRIDTADWSEFGAVRTGPAQCWAGPVLGV